MPAVKNKAWVKTPIDAFILAKLEEKNLQPNPRADKLTLLRRATIDMTGLPPTQEEIQAFLADKSPNAWEKVVDRLLASPAYGERWGRHWLDVARYADSNGFKADETRPNVWRYRDYVIKAFNDDKPYDRFVKEQIAGDELYPGNQEALVAMGFNRHWIDETNAPDLFERRHQTLDDMTTVTGVAFLGMTFGCARCHDHKFDPILTKDYYRLAGLFRQHRVRRRSAAAGRSGSQAQVRRAICRVGRQDQGHPRRDGQDHGADSRRAQETLGHSDDGRSAGRRMPRTQPSERHSSSRFITSPRLASAVWVIR